MIDSLTERVFTICAGEDLVEFHVNKLPASRGYAVLEKIRHDVLLLQNFSVFILYYILLLFLINR